MELAELKQKRKEFLEDTWKYYAEDVSRRAVVSIDCTKEKQLQSTCRYRTSDGKKCAIGRHIPDNMYDSRLEGQNIGGGQLSNAIPSEILDLGEHFLQTIQLLHDCDDNWNDHGLSAHGELMVAQIEEGFCV